MTFLPQAKRPVFDFKTALDGKFPYKLIINKTPPHKNDISELPVDDIIPLNFNPTTDGEKLLAIEIKRYKIQQLRLQNLGD